MSDFVNPTTREMVLSEHDRPAPWIICTRAQAEAWLPIPLKYRKWVVDHIEEMTAPQKTVADSNERNASRDAAAAQLTATEDALRAFMLVCLDEFNAHATKMKAILDAIDASTNYATLKTNIAAVTDYPQRTEAQLRSSVRGKLGT